MFDTISCNQDDLFHYFVRLYVREAQMRGKTVTFSDENFLRIGNRIFNEMPDDDPAPRSDSGEENPLFILDSVSNRLLESTHAPLTISENGKAGVETELLLLVVNPYSVKQAEAIQYLEFLSAKRTVEDYALFASMTDPALDDEVHALYLEACDALAEEKALAQEDKLLELATRAEELYSQQFVITQSAIDAYHALSDAFVVMLEEDITQSETMETLLSRLLDGNLPLEQFAEKADAYVRMKTSE